MKPFSLSQETGNDAIIKIVARVTPPRNVEKQETETLADATELPTDETDESELPPIPDVTVEEDGP